MNGTWRLAQTIGVFKWWNIRKTVPGFGINGTWLWYHQYHRPGTD